MTRTTSVTRNRRGLGARLAATAGIAMLCVAALPAASASAKPADMPSGAFYIQNDAWPGQYLLCASWNDDTLRLVAPAAGLGDRMCMWQQLGSDDNHFKLKSVARDDVAAITFDGNNNVVELQISNPSPNANAQYWSWGAPGQAGGRPLKSYQDSGQWIDAREPNSQELRVGDKILTSGGDHSNVVPALTWVKRR